MVLKITNVTKSNIFLNLSDVSSGSVFLRPQESRFTEASKITIGGSAPQSIYGPAAEGHLNPEAVATIEVFEAK